MAEYNFGESVSISANGTIVAGGTFGYYVKVFSQESNDS
jgi:hypothetical protein